MVVTNKEMLMDWGLSDYESRAYLTLLEFYPLTAYETAKRAGIPNPKIYDVMSRLLERSMVLIIEEDKKRYIPKEPREYIEQQRRQVNRQLDQMEESLKQIPKGPDHSVVWNIRNLEALMDQARSLIDRAEGNLLLSLWPQEYLLLEETLKKAENRGVKVALVQFGDQKGEVGQCYHHPISDTLFEEKGGRSLVISADSSVALMGLIGRENRVEASWSRSFGFSSLAEDYIRHDIYIMKIVERFDRQLTQRFGENYHLLRDLFHNEEQNYE